MSLIPTGTLSLFHHFHKKKLEKSCLTLKNLYPDVILIKNPFEYFLINATTPALKPLRSIP